MGVGFSPIVVADFRSQWAKWLYPVTGWVYPVTGWAYPVTGWAYPAAGLSSDWLGLSSDWLGFSRGWLASERILSGGGIFAVWVSFAFSVASEWFASVSDATSSLHTN